MGIGGANCVRRLAPTFPRPAIRGLTADLMVQIPIEERERGRDDLSASAYHAVLAVKDERGTHSPPTAVFDP